MSASERQQHDSRAGNGSASATVADLRLEARRALETASRETLRLGQYAQTRAWLAAESQKSELARTISGIAGDMRAASRSLADQQNIGAVIDQAADQVDAFASQIRSRSTRDIARDAEDVCRRHPVAVAASAFVLGAFIARALASADDGRGEARVKGKV